MVLEIDNVTKEYRRGVRANDAISLSVAPGEVFGLLGPNGAGKTTLVSQIVGLAAPTAGRITIAGTDIVAHPGFARQSCSLQPQSQVPLAGLTPRQAIEILGRLRGGARNAVRRRGAELVAALDLGSWLDTPGERLSGGIRRLVAFCMAAVVPGRVVVLDEPTNDVDPLRRRLLWGQVRRLADEGCAVLLVTHNVLEAERAVDRLAIVDGGQLRALGTPAALKARVSGDLRLEVVFEPGTPPAVPDFATSPVLAGRRLVATVRAGQAATAVAWTNELRQGGLVEEFSLAAMTLEDVYGRLVGRADAPEAAEGGIHREPALA